MFTTSALGISVLAGLFTAAWGAYKDAPYERFSHASFWRSVVFSVALCIVVLTSFRTRVAHLYMVDVFFLVMGLERIAIEIYKPCFRREDQSKYLIPQDGSFFGLHLDNDIALVTIGIGLIAAILGLLSIRTEIRTFSQHMTVSVATGLFICIGGAAKDAPFEGFQPRKFLRSALVLAAVSPLIYKLGPAPLGVLLFVNGGAILAWRPVFRVVAASTSILVGILYAHAL